MHFVLYLLFWLQTMKKHPHLSDMKLFKTIRLNNYNRCGILFFTVSYPFYFFVFLERKQHTFIC